ncbi:MAG: hypothetical protein KDE51_25840, partial [Anaerolineales bacterium]|nr:hypothetical protein [Anaerolineales bacterium]
MSDDIPNLNINSGAAATGDHSKAVGQGGILNEGQARDFITGSFNTITNITHIYQQQPTDEKPRTTPLPHEPRLKKLFGRAAEKAHLSQLCQTIAQTETGQLLFVSGDHGYGRYALTQWLTFEEAAQQNYNVHHSHVDDNKVEELIKTWRDTALRSGVRHTITIVVLEGANNIDPTWQITIEKFVRRELHDLPLLLLIPIYAPVSLANPDSQLVGDVQQWAQAMLNNQQATELYLGSISDKDIETLTGPCDSRLITRLQNISNGQPSAVLDQWERWQHLELITRNTQGIWQIQDEQIWGKDWHQFVDEQLANRLQMYEDDAPPYSEEM